MAEHRLQPLSPLGHAEPLAEALGPCTLAEVTDIALASLAARAGKAKDLAKRAKKAGVPLPGPGLAEAGPVCAAFWMGPDMWMVEAPLVSHDDIVAMLKPAFAECASISEQTDGWARFRISGPDLPRLFERLCNADLSSAQPGAAIRTVIEHLGAFLLVREANVIDVLTARSSAGSMHHALHAAAESAF
jgi:sarcosine oxidase subunit gamma